MKHKNTQPLYIFNRVRVLHLNRLKERTWLHSFGKIEFEKSSWFLVYFKLHFRNKYHRTLFHFHNYLMLIREFSICNAHSGGAWSSAHVISKGRIYFCIRRILSTNQCLILYTYLGVKSRKKFVYMKGQHNVEFCIHMSSRCHHLYTHFDLNLGH